jgi:hypothetical protein
MTSHTFTCWVGYLILPVVHKAAIKERGVDQRVDQSEILSYARRLRRDVGKHSCQKWLRLYRRSIDDRVSRIRA